MTSSHLTERDLQEAAESFFRLPASQAAHLQGCPVCQGRVKTYQRLFAAAARLPQPIFTFDLTASVLAQLPQAKPAFPWVLVLVALLVLGVLSVFLVFFGRALLPVFQVVSTGLGAGLVLVAGFMVAGQCLELLARHRRRMGLLAIS